jgi:hypothetical protein
MSIFTSSELFGSISIACRIENVIICILLEGNDTQKYSPWNMKFLMVKYLHISLTTWLIRTKSTVFVMIFTMRSFISQRLYFCLSFPSRSILMITFPIRQAIEIESNYYEEVKIDIMHFSNLQFGVEDSTFRFFWIYETTGKSANTRCK